MDPNIIKMLADTIESNNSSSDESDSTSSESSDEITKLRHKRIKISQYVEEIVPKCSDKEFREHFRLTRKAIDKLYGIHDIFVKKNYKGGWPQITREKGVLMFVWYLANNETYRQIADRFNVSKSSAHDFIYKFSHILSSNANQWIKWPTEEEAKATASTYNKISNILGFIDGCHIRINKPHEHGDDFINRKGYPSILLQGVVNHKKMFINATAGAPGSTHDGRHLRNTYLNQNAEKLFFNKYRLLGDSAYPAKNWLLTPKKDNGLLTDEDREFNKMHSSIRVAVEHAFGLLKGRFRRLNNFVNDDLTLIVNLIISACILHNITIECNDEGEDFIVEMDEVGNIDNMND